MKIFSWLFDAMARRVVSYVARQVFQLVVCAVATCEHALYHGRPAARMELLYGSTDGGKVNEGTAENKTESTLDRIRSAQMKLNREYPVILRKQGYQELL